MQVIPVLDLLDAHAVHAVRGERSRYRPVRSTLCATSEPLSVARSLMTVTQSRVVYVADLDAILGRGDHAVLLAALCDSLGEGAVVWLDAGFVDFASMRGMLGRIRALAGASSAQVVPVFGTESLRDVHAISQALDDGFDPILSLDFRGGGGIGDVDAALWPARVIVMTLDRVGAGSGPDLVTLADTRARAGARGVRLFGAGGVRDQSDLLQAQLSGAEGWLVASALHDGSVFL